MAYIFFYNEVSNHAHVRLSHTAKVYELSVFTANHLMSQEDITNCFVECRKVSQRVHESQYASAIRISLRSERIHRTFTCRQKIHLQQMESTSGFFTRLARSMVQKCRSTKRAKSESQKNSITPIE